MDINSHNFEDSLARDYDSHNQSMDSEALYLKKKLIETHNKLIREVEANKMLEDQMTAMHAKNDSLNKQIQLLNRRLLQSNKQRERDQTDRSQQVDRRLAEAENKHQLLRVDLESMRNRLLSEMLEKNRLEEELKQRTRKQLQAENKLKESQTELKKRDSEYGTLESTLQHTRAKYQAVLDSQKKIQTQYQEARRTESLATGRITQLEAALKTEKDRNQASNHEFKILQKQLVNCRTKLEAAENTISQLKSKMYQENKERPVGQTGAMEKMAQEFNILSAKYKQLEKELEEARQRPATEATKKRRQYMDSKQLVERLQSEQQKLRNRRSDESPSSPVRPPTTTRTNQNRSTTPVAERQQYMDKISEIGVLENRLLQCHLNRNNILNEIDKIENTKVKTNQLLHRRRKLEEQLKLSEAVAEQTKQKLKQLNVI